jgi:hypothetical protein
MKRRPRSTEAASTIRLKPRPRSPEIAVYDGLKYAELGSLRVPPGNHLEALKADRKGQHSIRVNDQWRICFVWKTDGAHRVEIVDYH